MLPILVSLGPIKIYSFGVCLAIGLFLGLYWWWKMGRDEHFDEIALFDGFFLSVITYLVAGRIGYVILHASGVGTAYRMLAILSYPGINALIGLSAATIFLLLFARAHSWDLWKVADSVVVALSLILAMSGLGGWLNGSNPGIETSWGRIPVDLWTMVWALLTFAVVSKVRKNFRFYAWYKGESSIAAEGLAGLIFLLSGGIYFMVEGWIDQNSWMMWGRLPGEFLMGLGIVGVSVFLINKRKGRREASWWGKLKNIIRRK